jgi:hypothetical protein
MNSLPDPWRLSAFLLLLSGFVIAGIGLYFIAARPSLLPEDIRYMRLAPEELATLNGPLGDWLGKVFTVLGGFALATGLLTMSLAATAYRTRSRAAFVGAAAGGVSSIGVMSAVNIAIDSDFKWTLVGFAALWTASLLCYVLEARKPRSPTRQNKDYDNETP